MEEKDTLNEIVNEETVETVEQTTDLTDDEKAYREFVDGLEAKWYALHTFSGYENVAKENLETVVEKFNLQDRIFDIVIPMEDVVEEKNGKKKLVQRKSMPTYILAKIKYADDIWHNIIHTRGVTGFVGPGSQPVPLTPTEMRNMGFDGGIIPVDIDVHVGDAVEVISGAWEEVTGIVQSINEAKQTVTITIDMFGRETPVEIGFADIKLL